MFNFNVVGGANNGLVFIVAFIAAGLAWAAQSAAQPSSSSRASAEKRANEVVVEEPVRTWVDDSGQFRTEARLVEFDGKVATLLKANGVTIHVPIEKLSAQDREYLVAWLEKTKTPRDSEIGFEEPQEGPGERVADAERNQKTNSTDSPLIRNEAVWGYVNLLLQVGGQQGISQSKLLSAELVDPEVDTKTRDQQRRTDDILQPDEADGRLASSGAEIDPVMGVQPAPPNPENGSTSTSEKPGKGMAGLAGQLASLGQRDARKSSMAAEVKEKGSAPEDVVTQDPVEEPRRDDPPAKANDPVEPDQTAQLAMTPETIAGGGNPNESAGAQNVQPAPKTSATPTTAPKNLATSDSPDGVEVLRFEHADLDRPLPDRSWVQKQPAVLRPHLDALVSGDDPVQIRRSLRYLAEHPPTVVDEGYWDILAHYVQGNDKFFRLEGLKAMRAVAPKRILPYLIYLLDDSTFEVRWLVYDYLAEIEDDRVIEPLVDHYLTNERNQIEILLLPYGPKTEKLLFRFLRHPDVEVRSDVVKFLGKVGSEPSIEALRQLENDSSVTVRLQARSSIRRIEKRLANNK